MVDRERDAEVERTTNEYYALGMIKYLIKFYKDFREHSPLITRILVDYLGCQVYFDIKGKIKVSYKGDVMYDETKED